MVKINSEGTPQLANSYLLTYSLSGYIAVLADKDTRLPGYQRKEYQPVQSRLTDRLASAEAGSSLSRYIRARCVHLSLVPTIKVAKCG